MKVVSRARLVVVGCLLATLAGGSLGCKDAHTHAPAADGSAGTSDAGTNDGPAAGATDTPTGADAGPMTSALTYWNDIAPILNDKCVKCHQAGGIGPFPLDAYDIAADNALAIAAYTQLGLMPPYLVTHDGTCGDFKDEETLTAVELAKINEWAHGDRKQGSPRVIPKTPPVGLAGPAVKEWKTPNIAPVAQGGDAARHDEYRCYLIEPGLQRDQFITGYEVLPGTPALVHHMIAFVVNPNKRVPDGRSNAAVMDALDKMDPDRPGWPCFGMAGKDVAPDSMPGVWAPGQGPVVFPNGVGVTMKATDKLVVQIHYNLTDPSSPGKSDTTAVRFQLADAVPRRAVFIAEDALLDSLGSANPITLEPGRMSVKRTWKRSLAEMGLGGLPYVDVMAVMPHMHERGVRKEMRLGHEGAMTCAARVERWDFHWQKAYFYKSPWRLDPRSQLELTCEYDTTRDQTPVLPGWGTRNEMCTAILMLALPPGL